MYLFQDFIVPATLTTGYHPATSSIGDPHTRRNRQSKLLGIHMHSSEIDSVILSPSYENNRASRIYTDSSVLLNKALSAHIQGTESASNLFTKMYSIHEHTIVSSTTNVTTIARKIPMELKTYQTLLYVEGVITHGNIHPTTSTRRDISAECSCTVPHSHDQCRRQCWTEYTHGTTHHLRSPTELVTSTIPDTSPSRGLPSDYTSTVGPVNNGCRYSHTCVICWTIFTLLYQTSQIK